MDSSNWYAMLPDESKVQFDSIFRQGPAAVTFSPPLPCIPTTDHTLPHTFAVEVRAGGKAADKPRNNT